MSPGAWELAAVIVGGVATLAIFSFLIKENPFYRLFEHLFIGIAAGFTVVFGVKDFLWPKILVPMFGLDIVTFPDGTTSHPYNPTYLLYLLPLCFGLLYYFIYSKRHYWLAKLVIGFTLGAGGGLAFKGFFNEIMPQVFKSFRPLLVFEDGTFSAAASIENTIFVFTLLAVMYYFFFSFRQRSVVSQGFADTGRWLMMLCFGAFFGSTVMARMALLVERVGFLTNEWIAALMQAFTGA